MCIKQMSLIESALCAAIAMLGPAATVAAVRTMLLSQFPADAATINTLLLQHVLAQQQLSLPISFSFQKTKISKRRKHMPRRSRQKSGCYRARKSPCKNNDRCTWVTRKGCRVSKTRVRNKQ